MSFLIREDQLCTWHDIFMKCKTDFLEDSDLNDCMSITSALKTKKNVFTIF